MNRWKGWCIALMYGVSAQAAPVIYGWAERGVLEPAGLMMDLKLDTGADTSSLDARQLREFERDGERWVSFTVRGEDKEGARTVRIEREVIRYVRVRGAGGSDNRPVVRMAICIGNRLLEDEFTLNDRKKMSYPVLIGRNTLAQMNAAVAANRSYTLTPGCP
ncbi:ATP-dependent zinc protease [Aeromonas schubertii]|uniref:ATP-dependent Zn protease n=1 Tax=Aeromonas schubertii TaxID=652 RepID=A0A0S2SHT7_9GAMM|nr:ATP-dependent zinc protease [Aeromonas schubertii]ALP41272.1 ATP-dependent Zn protease [Aeromonas schubertii]MBZ6064983.1 ATP-dependent zinc protease [Aeromonas schubertii]MBZ6073649.1 ATP-dependent zinc protease [Aeromonas schubertii]